MVPSARDHSGPAVATFNTNAFGIRDAFHSRFRLNADRIRLEYNNSKSGFYDLSSRYE
jgi:hypothetical protein